MQLGFATTSSQSVPHASVPSVVVAITPVFGAHPKYKSFHTTLQGQHNLMQVGARYAGNPNALIAIYCVQSTEWAYNPNSTEYGRVLALARPLLMPPGSTVHTYPSGCPILQRGQIVDRWPVGWPCEYVFYSSHGGPDLSHVFYAVRAAIGSSDYASFAHQFLQGPLDLGRPRYRPLADRLMAEIRHEVARNPQSMCLPF
jgi:hypothetical protein